jgi:glycosyltransferase involved in cell wall biosynthesis
VSDWHIITGEYPPQPGGVSDYTRRIARGLADAGDSVEVWAPPVNDSGAAFGESSATGQPADPDVTVRRLPDRFGPASLRHLTKELDRQPRPCRLLVQYVPHAFGWKAANVPFCLWLQSRRHDSVWVMFHEVAFPFGRGQSLSHNALAAVNRLMASIVASSAERAYVSIPGWRDDVQSMMAGKPVEWLPVPSSIPVVPDPAATAAVRAHYGTRPVVGHFGTYGRAIRSLLATAVPALTGAADCAVLLVGRQGDDLQRELVARHPQLTGRVHATGALPDASVSLHIAACDVMLQPYPDGISSRRTSAMVALAHGVPMVTTSGWLTEPLWEESGAACLVPAGDPEALAPAAARLLASPAERLAISARARNLYATRFDVAHSIQALRSAADQALHLVEK